MDKAFEDYSSQRRAAKAAGGGTSEPRGLWEELLDIGDEFVDFLEQGLGTDDDEQAAFDSYRRGAAGGSRPSSSRAGSGQGASASGPAGQPSGSASRTSSAQPAAPGKSSAEVIEDELQALKKKLGKF